MKDLEQNKISIQIQKSLDIFGSPNIPSSVGLRSFPGGSSSKESACTAGDSGSIPELGRSPGEGNSYPCQFSCLENSMDRGAWQARVHVVTKS